MLKKIILFLLTYFLLFLNSTSAAVSIPVENVFSDISTEYWYYNELQTLYDRGMVFPDEDGDFNPLRLLNRDEFVWISMEVICKKCISPNTDYNFIEAFAWTQPFFDVFETNKYFYCIAEAEDKNYVKWYDPGVVCEDWTTKENEVPFCVNNKITKEESIAVILRNSWIFTEEDNNLVIADIYAGVSFPDLSEDVSATHLDWSPNSFYWYLRKALEYEYIEYDAEWNEKVYKLLEVVDWKIYPKKSVTKEEFLKTAYIALKSNSCIDRQEDQIALEMKVYDKTCDVTVASCELSDLIDPENTYDFDAEVETTCEAWLTDPDSYIWRYYNTYTGEQVNRYGKYIDDYTFLTPWVWLIYLRVIDNCGNTWEVHNTISVPAWDNDLALQMLIYDKDCSENDTSCTLSDLADEENIYDFEAEVWWVCSAWIDNPDGYEWTFINESFWEILYKTGQYIENYEFLSSWTWKVILKVTDNCGNTWEVYSTIIVPDQDGNIDNINVDIEANPIIWPWPLEVDFEWLISWWEGPYTYSWDFWDGNTGEWKNIVNTFESAWLYEVELIVVDSNWLEWTSTVLIKVTDDNLDIPMNWSLDCDPLLWPGPLNVNCIPIVSGWVWPYDYSWDFWDWNSWFWDDVTNIFLEEGIYEIELTITDSEGRKVTGTVIIHVTDEQICDIDSDNDLINDCEDKCPLVPWVDLNEGCPILSEFCGSDCSCPDNFTCNNSDPDVCSIKWICVPIEDTTDTCLYKGFTSIIYWNAVCNSCPCPSFLDFRSVLRRCDTIFPAITSPDSTIIYSKWDDYKIE